MKQQWIDDVPDIVKQEIDNYVEKGERPSEMIMAALSNDFHRVIHLCNWQNKSKLKEISWYIQGHVPKNMHGDYESVRKNLRRS